MKQVAEHRVELFSLALEGHGDPHIARRLNARGLRTSTGKPWTRRQVQNVLTNPVYAGAVVFHRATDTAEVNWNGRHEALVERKTFERLIRERAGRDKAAGRRPKGGRPTARFLLSRLAECARCGARMYCRTDPYKRKDGSHRRTYVCANVHGRTGLCACPEINADSVDTMVTSELPNVLLDFARLVDAATREHERLVADTQDTLSAALAALDRARGDEVRVREDYVRQVSAGREDAAEVAADALASLSSWAAELEERADVLSARLSELSDGSPTDAALDAYNARRSALRRLHEAYRLRRRTPSYGLSSAPSGWISQLTPC